MHWHVLKKINIHSSFWKTPWSGSLQLGKIKQKRRDRNQKKVLAEKLILLKQRVISGLKMFSNPSKNPTIYFSQYAEPTIIYIF